jgi:hypothetical protein
MSAVTFYNGRAIAPCPPADVIDSISDKTKWTAGPLNYHDRHWVQVGARHGYLAGWYAGFAAASGMEARQGGNEVPSRSDDSPTAAPSGGDATTPGERESGD